jgi:hypothetical protein
MLGTALYYPHIDILDSEWLKSAILFWDNIQTIVPTSIKDPYQSEDTKICEQEGYLSPLRCDLHPELLEELGRRVFKLLEDQEWHRQFHGSQNAESPAANALIHSDKLSEQLKWRLEELIGVHPDKMPPALISALNQEGGLELLSAYKVSPSIRRILQDLQVFGMHSEKLSYQMRDFLRKRPYREDGDWILVNGRFAEIYMSALAALLSKEVQVSPLTNEEPSSGVNLRCMVDDVAASGEMAARGALVSVVMKGLKINPETSVKKLIGFRRGRKDQIAELSGYFDDLKVKIEKASSAHELEEGAKRLFENKIHPGLEKLKKELDSQSIQSVWDGVQRGISVSAATTGALAYITGYTGPMLLGATAFITLSDVGVKSYLAKSKLRASSPYTYLLDVQRKFSLPQY